MKLYNGIKSKYSDHVEVDCEATLSDLKQAAAELGMVLVPESVEGKIHRARNCLELGNDGDALNRLCQAIDLIEEAEGEEND